MWNIRTYMYSFQSVPEPCCSSCCKNNLWRNISRLTRITGSVGFSPNEGKSAITTQVSQKRGQIGEQKHIFQTKSGSMSAVESVVIISGCFLLRSNHFYYQLRTSKLESASWNVYIHTVSPLDSPEGCWIVFSCLNFKKWIPQQICLNLIKEDLTDSCQVPREYIYIYLRNNHALAYDNSKKSDIECVFPLGPLSWDCLLLLLTIYNTIHYFRTNQQLTRSRK